ncbi:MAG: hypothetical protein ABR586_04245 [Thermoplasmatota archaeon]
MEGPKRHQAGERRVRRATRSASSILRGTNVHASQPARRRRGTPTQRNRGFNPLGPHHARVADDGP